MSEGSAPDLTVVVLVSRRDVAEVHALASLRARASENIEVLILENYSNSNFRSLARAYNAAAVRSRGRYLMFLHQDAELAGEPGQLSQLVTLLDRRPFAIAGASGVAGSRLFYSDLEVLRTNPELEFQEVRGADVLDEPLFVVPRQLLIRTPFDPKLTDGFHLCAAEYSLRARRNGQTVLLVPVTFRHFNLAPARPDGSVDGAAKRVHMIQWLRAARRLSKAYPEYQIVTPQGRLGVRLFLMYWLFYQGLMACFPDVGVRAIDWMNLGRGSYALNRWAKGLRYGDS